MNEDNGKLAVFVPLLIWTKNFFTSQLITQNHLQSLTDKSRKKQVN